MGTLSNFGSPVLRRMPRDFGDIGRTATLALAGALLLVDAWVLASSWEPSHWEPLALVVVIAASTILGELAAVRIGPIYVSSTSCSTLLALALLGPAPAALIAALASVLEWLVDRRAPWAGVTNLAIATSSALAGAAVLSTAEPGLTLAYAAALFAAGVAVMAANGAILSIYRKLTFQADIRRELVELFLPTAPYQVLGVTLATGAVLIVVTADFPTLAAVIPALVVSEFILRYIAAERSRAEEVMALTNARANLLEQALGAEESERAWLAGHVHDETLQTLALARQELDEAADGDARAARAHIDTAIEELRRTLSHVHPGSVIRDGLGRALETYAAQVFARRGVSWTVDVAPDLGEEHHALLYSLARELVGNAAKHARAAHVTLTAARTGGHVTLTVSDDGGGFAPGAADAPGHYGLLTLRHRVTAAGGTVTIAGGPGATVVIELPATT